MRSEVLIYDLRPIPAPRPRVTRWGTYNDPKYTAYKDTIKSLTKMGKPFDGAIRMTILFQFAKTKSWSKKKKANAYWHTQRPDTDNLTKGIQDALNGIAYKDDSQICDLDVVKIWGDCDKIVVEMNEI